MESSFLERMNTLLANGEVPGLFEGDDYTTLMTQCKEVSREFKGDKRGSNCLEPLSRALRKKA